MDSLCMNGWGGVKIMHFLQGKALVFWDPRNLQRALRRRASQPAQRASPASQPAGPQNCGKVPSGFYAYRLLRGYPPFVAAELSERQHG